MSYKLTNKNHDRRYGNKCKNCGKKIKYLKLEGTYGGKSVVFCSTNCCDVFMDEQEKKKRIFLNDNNTNQE